MIKKIGIVLVCGLAVSAHLLPAAKRGTKRSIDDTASSGGALKAQAVSAVPLYDPARLRDHAEGQQLGYKTGNLYELEHFCAWFNTQGVSAPVIVPRFLGISSRAVQDLLGRIGFDIAGAWREVLTAVLPPAAGGAGGSDEAAVESSGDTTAFNDAFMQRRQQFENQVTAAFNRLMETASLIHAWAAENGIEGFLAQAATTEAKLMVRSTGKEDTETLANAGGNKSIPYVEPIVMAVIGAMKEVVLSYFGKKSLSQRLRQNDPTVFAPDVFVPVLLQEMVFETDVAIPTSGVLFTQDQQSGTRCGVSIIQAAFGHGEGVVNSLVPADTYYAIRMSDALWALYPIISNKTDRLVPVEGTTTLGRVRNDGRYAKQSALSNEMVKLLAMLGEAVERYYHRPMDIEFVVQNNQVCIVQARPLVPRVYGPGEEPSYVADATKKQMTSAGAWQAITGGSAIVAAGGSARLVQNQKQVIIAKTIGEALAVYSDKKAPEQEAVLAVIIGTKAPTTSHEATTLRGEGKAVVFLPGWEEVKQAVSSKKQLLIDVQQGQVMIAGVFPSKEEVVMPGWITYPGERALSLEPSFFTNIVDVPSMPELKNRPIPDMHVLLHQLKVASPAAVKNIADIVVYRVMAMINRERGDLDLDQDLAAKSRLLVRGVKQLCSDIVVWASQGDEGFMRRLLSIRLLEALIYQQDPAIVKGFAAATLGKTLRAENSIDAATAGMVFASPEAKALYVQLAKIPAIMCNDDLKAAWMQFIGVAAQNHAAIQQLAEIIQKLAALDVLPTWLHTECAAQLLGFSIADKSASFASRAWSMCGHMASNIIGWGSAKVGMQRLSVAQTRSMMHTWQQALLRDQAVIQQCAELNRLIETVNAASFGSPETFGKAWEALEVGLINKLVDPAFGIAFTKAGNVGRAVACSMLQRVIEKFDLAIKAMLGNAEWSATERAPLFKVMLQQYRNLLFALMSLAPASWSLAASSGPKVFIYDERFKILVNNRLEKTFTGADLQATSNGSIQSYVWGVCTHSLNSGSDVFSMIHQSLLVLLSVLMPYEPAEIARPLLLQQCEKNILQKTVLDQVRFPLLPAVNFVGMRCTADGMHAYYNMPFVCHSGQFELIFDRKTGLVDMAVHFYGGSRGRWISIATGALFCAVNGIAKLKSCELGAEAVSFVMTIDNYTKLQKLHDMIYRMANAARPTNAADFTLFDYTLAIIPQLKQYAATVMDERSFDLVNNQGLNAIELAILDSKIQSKELSFQQAFDAWLSIIQRYPNGFVGYGKTLGLLLGFPECNNQLLPQIVPSFLNYPRVFQNIGFDAKFLLVKWLAKVAFAVDPVLQEVFGQTRYMHHLPAISSEAGYWSSGEHYWGCGRFLKNCFSSSGFYYLSSSHVSPMLVQQRFGYIESYGSFAIQLELGCAVDRTTPEKPVAVIDLFLTHPQTSEYYERLHAKIAEVLARGDFSMVVPATADQQLCRVTYRPGFPVKDIADFLDSIGQLAYEVMCEMQVVDGVSDKIQDIERSAKA